MTRILKMAVLWTVLACALFTASAASAADVTFVMKNEHPNAVEVELYSQDRQGYVWPGNNQIYLLDDGESKTMHIACQDGEKICYGAWISGDKSTYWGVGPGSSQACDDCCYTCTGGNTEEIDLAE